MTEQTKRVEVEAEVGPGFRIVMILAAWCAVLGIVFTHIGK